MDLESNKGWMQKKVNNSAISDVENKTKVESLK